MNRRDFLSRLALFSILPVGLNACSGPQPPLRIGIHPWIGYEPLLLADEFGWLDNKIELVKGSIAGDSLNALQAGRLDAAALTLDEVLLARNKGIPLTIVAVLDVSAGADMFLARPDIKSLQDIRGKRVGVENSALGATVLIKVLDAAGLTQEDISPVDLAPDRQVQAWDDGMVDAVVTYEPTASMLLRRGAIKLFDSRDMPDTIFDVLAVHNDLLKSRSEHIDKLVSAHFRGLEYIRINRGDALYRIAAHQQVTLAEVKNALAGVTLPDLSGNQQYLAKGSRLKVAAEQLNRLMADRGLLNQPDDLRNLFSNDYLPDE